MSDIIVAKRCTGCQKVLPIEDFPHSAAGRRLRADCHACHRAKSLANYHLRRITAVTYSDKEMLALRMHYPQGGSAACQPYMPKRSRAAIQRAAANAGLKYDGPTVSGTKSKNDTWGVPVHEYTEPDIAMRDWRCGMPSAALRCAL